MPSKIEQVFEQPKISELVLALGVESVKRQIEFELVNLADLMSVGGNLNNAQVTFIAEEFVNLYPTESIADFKICFRRGALGAYGQIQRMDGITLREWMDKYLDEKYQVMEEMLMKEKDNIYKPIDLTDSEKLHLVNIDSMLEKYKQSIKGMEQRPVRPLSESEILEEGQQEPKTVKYIPPSKEQVISMLRHNEWIRENFDSYTGKKKETWISEDQWLKQFGGSTKVKTIKTK